MYIIYVRIVGMRIGFLWLFVDVVRCGSFVVMVDSFGFSLFLVLCLIV